MGDVRSCGSFGRTVAVLSAHVSLASSTARKGGKARAVASAAVAEVTRSLVASLPELLPEVAGTALYSSMSQLNVSPKRWAALNRAGKDMRDWLIYTATDFVPVNESDQGREWANEATPLHFSEATT